MKKRALFLCMVATLISFSDCEKNYTHEVYEMAISASNICNNSVGNDWEIVYTCDGKIINSSEQWVVPIGNTRTIVVDITITEKDKWSDYGYGSMSIVLSDNFKTSEIITVTENKGRYKGNIANWEITCKVDSLKKIEQE